MQRSDGALYELIKKQTKKKAISIGLGSHLQRELAISHEKFCRQFCHLLVDVSLEFGGADLNDL
jgi:hypothetical protein